MADEFAKGFGILVTAGLGWMTLAAWYCTPNFEGAQLTGTCTSAGTAFDQLALLVKDGLFWFAVLGFFTFVVVIPAVREARRTWADDET